MQLPSRSISSKRSINQSRLGRSIKVNRHTIRKNRKLLGIHYEYSNISDAELDILVANYKLSHNESGSRYVRGFLKANRLRIQKYRVFASLRRLDALGMLSVSDALFAGGSMQQRGPNCLWHCDGHHKLIRWGIVIHGFIDGFCRTVSLMINLLSNYTCI